MNPEHSSTFDADGYPTDKALEALEAFTGTPLQFLDAATALFNGGIVRVNPGKNDFGQDVLNVSFVAGGWSGCESVIGTIKQTLFHTLFWAASHRGGLHEYEIETTMAEEPFLVPLVKREPDVLEYGVRFAPTNVTVRVPTLERAKEVNGLNREELGDGVVVFRRKASQWEPLDQNPEP
ncbi:MAG: hypothetical protein HIU81_13270 [Acidobacteria bacterium]|nr:hypothetical protein [Acidobacteriota bacterium]